MPPKPRISKDTIIQKAFELTRIHGFENVTARLLAAELNCSTQPIFHVFHNMDELKEAVYKKTQLFFEENMLCPDSSQKVPPFLYMGLKYIELAQKEKALFRLLCMSDCGKQQESLYDLAKHLPLPMNPDVFVKTWIFAHGIATIVSTNTTNYSPDEIKTLLTEACESFQMYQAKKEQENEKK